MEESDSDDGGMASGIMTPPRRTEKVIAEKINTSGVDVDELEEYLKK